MQVEDFYFLKINLNFVLTSKNEKEEAKKEFVKRSWGQQSRGIMDIITKSTQQSNWTEGGGGVPCWKLTELNTSSSKKQANL